MSTQTSDLDAFEQQVRAFLEAHLPPRPAERRSLVWGAGEDTGVALWEEPDSAEERERLALAREWRRTRFDAGYGWLSGLPERGGAGLSSDHERIYRRVEKEFAVPDQNYFKLDHVVGPVVQQYGTEEVGSTVPRALQRGDMIACELFSEPEAGSDLFSARCKATRTDDGWRITGQKVWTSDAHLADIGILFCRTGGEGRSAFSTFVVDMDQPGVRVVPLRQMTGGAAFNEVYLDDAVVPEHGLLGEVGQGWDVVRDVLARERAGIGGGMGRSGSGIADGTRLVAMVRELAPDDPVVRQELATVVSRFWATRHLTRQGPDRAADPYLRANPVPLVSKLALGANLRGASDLVRRAAGARLIADSGEWGTYSWNAFVLGEPGVHIFAGTDEIVRNSLAEKVLGMPRG